jgi:Cu/Ag efflux pump CusA
VFDVVVQGVPETRRSLANVRNLLIDTPDGDHVRLRDVADVRVSQTPIAIQREAVSRYLDVEADVTGRSLEAIASDVEGRLADVSFPLEYHAEVLQKTTGEEINGRQILAFAGAAAIAIFLLLQAALRSWRLAVLTFLMLPVALVGGVLAALIDGAELSLGSMLAFLALFGLAVRQSVVLVRHLQELEVLHGDDPRRPLIERGARERLGPGLASIAATALVMVPFAIAGDIPGLEVVHPMAIVILGGLVTTALLALFALPTLYLRFGAGGRPSVSPEEEIMHRSAGIEPIPAGPPAGVASVPAGNGEGIRDRPPAG